MCALAKGKEKLESAQLAVCTQKLKLQEQLIQALGEGGEGDEMEAFLDDIGATSAKWLKVICSHLGCMVELHVAPHLGCTCHHVMIICADGKEQAAHLVGNGPMHRRGATI